MTRVRRPELVCGAVGLAIGALAGSVDAAVLGGLGGYFAGHSLRSTALALAG